MKKKLSRKEFEENEIKSPTCFAYEIKNDSTIFDKNEDGTYKNFNIEILYLSCSIYYTIGFSDGH